MKINYKAFLSNLLNLDFSEYDAERHWYQVLIHQKELKGILGRHVGFVVALTDYWTSKIKISEDLTLVGREGFLRIKKPSRSRHGTSLSGTLVVSF